MPEVEAGGQNGSSQKDLTFSSRIRKVIKFAFQRFLNSEILEAVEAKRGRGGQNGSSQKDLEFSSRI